MAKKEPQPLQEMFPSLFDGPYYLGTSIGEGWYPIAVEMCKTIQHGLSSDDLALFSFIQLKEKFGRYTCYFRPSNTMTLSLIGGDDGCTNIEIPKSTENQEPGLSVEGRALVVKAIEEAEMKAAHACENCPGVEGRLYTDEYWGVRCDKCAIEEDRIFPKAYGELIECRPHKREFGGRKAISTHALFFKNNSAAAWYRLEDDPKEIGPDPDAMRPFVFMDDLPDMLVRGFMDVGGYEVPYADWGTPDGPMAVWVDEFLDFVKKTAAKDQNTEGIISAYLKVPENARVDARTQLERDAKDCCGLEVKVTSVLPGIKMDAFAVGQQEDGTLHLLRIRKADGVPDVVKSPRHNLDSAIQTVEKLLASLKAARQLFEGTKS